MDNQEKERRMQLAITAEDWLNLYKEVFDEEPQLSGENWGAFPVEEIIDALVYGRRINEEAVPSSVVA